MCYIRIYYMLYEYNIHSVALHLVSIHLAVCILRDVFDWFSFLYLNCLSSANQKVL